MTQLEASELQRLDNLVNRMVARRMALGMVIEDLLMAVVDVLDQPEDLKLITAVHAQLAAKQQLDAVIKTRIDALRPRLAELQALRLGLTF